MALEKSPDAFRTISEVAEHLGVPAHVLRFWESRFTQIKPVKRAGGRRYYRRADMALIDGIRKLLHDDGMTIRAVQALLREKGVRAVAELARPLALDGLDATRPVTGDHAAARTPLPDGPAAPEPHATAPAPGADDPDAADGALPPDLPPPAEVPRSAEPMAPETGTADHLAAEHMDAPLLPEEAPLPPAEAPPAPELDRSEADAPDAPPPDAVPEAPMAQDVPVDDGPQVLRFIRSSGINRPMPPPPAAPPTQSELDLAPPPTAPAAAPAEPAPSEPEPDAPEPDAPEPPSAEPEPEPPPSLAVEVPDDPADDDPAHVAAPRTGFAALDPQVARGLRDRLAAIRRRLGDPPQRAR